MILFLLLSSNLAKCDSRISRDRVYRSIDSFLGHLTKTLLFNRAHFFPFTSEPYVFLPYAWFGNSFQRMTLVAFIKNEHNVFMYAILNLNPNTCIKRWTVASYPLVSLWSYRHHSKLMVFRSLVKLMSPSTFRL